MKSFMKKLVPVLISFMLILPLFVMYPKASSVYPALPSGVGTYYALLTDSNYNYFLVSSDTPFVLVYQINPFSNYECLFIYGDKSLVGDPKTTTNTYACKQWIYQNNSWYQYFSGGTGIGPFLMDTAHLPINTYSTMNYIGNVGIYDYGLSTDYSTINTNPTVVVAPPYDMGGAKGCNCSSFDSSWFQKWYDKECSNYATTWKMDELTVERLPQLAYWTRNNDGSITGVIDFFFNMTSIPSRMYYGLTNSNDIILVYASPTNGQDWSSIKYPFNTQSIITQDMFTLSVNNVSTHTTTNNNMFDGTNYTNLSVLNCGKVAKDNFHYYYSAPFHQLMWFTAIASQTDFTSSANINSYSPTQSNQTPENNSNPNNLTSQESTWASQTSAANAITFSISDPSTWLNPVYAALQWMVDSQPVQALESFIQLSIGWLPPEITTIMTLGVLLCVILRVLGR